MTYQKVLIAVDLGDTSAHVLQRGLEIAQRNEAELHVLHAVEPLSITYGGDIPMDFSSIQDEIYEQAQTQLANACQTLGLDVARQHLIIGRPEVEIPATAKELQADLIVVGSHERYGLALLIGSTADGVLHSAECDVLAVRVSKKH